MSPWWPIQPAGRTLTTLLLAHPFHRTILARGPRTPSLRLTRLRGSIRPVPSLSRHGSLSRSETVPQPCPVGGPRKDCPHRCAPARAAWYRAPRGPQRDPAGPPPGAGSPDARAGGRRQWPLRIFTPCGGFTPCGAQPKSPRESEGPTAGWGAANRPPSRQVFVEHLLCGRTPPRPKTRW